MSGDYFEYSVEPLGKTKNVYTFIALCFANDENGIGIYHIKDIKLIEKIASTAESIWSWKSERRINYINYRRNCDKNE